MKDTKLPIFVVILLCLFAHFGCDSGSELFLGKEEKGAMEYEYVEVDLALMAKLDQITDEDAAGGEPQIEFFDDREPIRRFWSYEDYYTSVDLISKKSRLTGEPILLHQFLQKYLEYKHLIPIEELALVNYEGRLIIEDTLYTLAGTSYTKQHIDDLNTEVVNLSVFDPSRKMRDYLSKLIQDQGTLRVTDALISQMSAKSSEEKYPCNKPNYFTFVGGSDPTRSSDTDMCVADFNYPSIRVNPTDYKRTSNSNSH